MLKRLSPIACELICIGIALAICIILAIVP
jgi:hypothetical protein